MASLPEGLPSLEVLVEQVRTPGAARPEVDALIAGMSQPLTPEQSARERADLLLSLIEDEHVGDFTGSKGRTVRAAAVQALLNLGYPYALEVPPEALEARRSSPTARPGRPASSAGRYAGLSLIVLLGLLEMVPVIALDHYLDSARVWLYLFIGCTTFIPALLSVLGRNTDHEALHTTGYIWLLIVGLLWMVLGIIGLGSGAIGLIPMGMGVFTIVCALLMDSRQSDP